MFRATAFLPIVALSILAGCAVDPTERQLATYAQKLGVETTSPELTEIGRYPERRAARLEIPAQRTRPFTSYGLIDCGLLDLVGERNSGLGRVAPDSQRLLYEVRFIGRAEACLARAGDAGLSPEEEERLSEVVAEKRSYASALASNATLAGPELERLFAVDARLLSKAGDEEALAASTRSLEQLASFARAALEEGSELGLEDSEELERVLAVQHASPGLGSRLLRSLVWFTELLDLASERLERLASQQDTGAACREAEALFATFRTDYAEALRPQLMWLHRDGGQWLLALEALRGALGDGVSEPLDDFLARRLSTELEGAPYPRYAASLERHARAWSSLLEPCELWPPR